MKGFWKIWALVPDNGHSGVLVEAHLLVPSCIHWMLVGRRSASPQSLGWVLKGHPPKAYFALYPNLELRALILRTSLKSFRLPSSSMNSLLSYDGPSPNYEYGRLVSGKNCLLGDIKNVSMCIYVYTHVRIHIHIYTYIYTHIHIP